MAPAVRAKASQRAYPEQALTPRTPHSKAGSFKVQQGVSEPLLAQDDGPARPSQTRHSQDASHGRRLLHYLPLAMGVLCGLVLFMLTIISYRRPEVISWIIGDNDWDLYKNENGSSINKPSTPLHAHPSAPSISALPAQFGHEHEHDDVIIDYSNYTSFPLTTMEYAAECWKLNQKPHKHGDFWASDQHGVKDVLHIDNPAVCKSSITYSLDGEIGLAADLALIGQLAALARDRNKTFFIDDTHWNRGRWLDYFEDTSITQPGPEPGCLPPSPDELVACPRLARHWVLTSHTAKFHMTHDFNEAYEDPYQQYTNRKKPIFEMGRLSLQETIRPNPIMLDLIDQASLALHGQGYIGVHIRRGDQSAMSWKYHKGYVPVAEFLTAANETLAFLDDDISNVYVASDGSSGLVEFMEGAPEEWDIHASLATTGAQVEYSVNRETEGYFQHRWDEIDEEERAQLTRGMIIDLAMVTGAWSKNEGTKPAAIICTLNSHVCKIAAMILGWDKSMIEKRWVEIDNRGDIEPTWDAFKLYH